MGANATTPLKRFGAWLARANDTVYQAYTDGFVCTISDSTGNAIGITDSFNPPTTERCRNKGYGSAECEGITMPVKRGNYWKVENITGTPSSVFWIPLEP